MLAKLTSKNQLTLPKSVTDSLGPVQYFEVQVQSGQVVLTPVRIQRGDAVRAKLAELDLDDDVLTQALNWAVDGSSPTRAARKSGKAVKAAKVAKPAAKVGIKKTVKAVDVTPVEKAGRTAKSPRTAKNVAASSGAAGANAVKAVKPIKAVKAPPTRTPVSKPRRRSAA